SPSLRRLSPVTPPSGRRRLPTRPTLVRSFLLSWLPPLWPSSVDGTGMQRTGCATSLFPGTRCPRESGLLVDLGALLHELDRLLLHALFQRALLGQTLLLGVFAHVLRDLHRAEMRTAHRAEVSELGALLRQRLVVELLRLVRVEAEVELVLPAELETRFRQRVIADLRPRMSLGEVGGVRRDLVRHDAVLDVVLVRQAEMLLGRHVAE